MKILIYGSTYLTAAVCELLRQHQDEFTLVGYIPSIFARIPGRMPPISLATKDAEHHIKLSIQYDYKIEDIDNAYNVHTGLLPKWGGCNILSHTLKNGNTEQGATFHRMGKNFDHGPLISKITYPVFQHDTIVDLYGRLAVILPPFTLSCLRLLKTLSEEQISECPILKPTIYKRNNEVDKNLPLLRETFR